MTILDDGDGMYLITPLITCNGNNITSIKDCLSLSILNSCRTRHAGTGV